MASSSADKIAEAFVDLRINMDQLNADLAKSEALVKKSTGKMESEFKSFNNAIATGFGAARTALAAIGPAAVGAAGALALAAKKSLDFASDLVDTSRNLGISTDALQELGFAATQSGVSVESLNNALGFLAKAQAESLDSGSNAADMFRRLGIEATNADGSFRPLEELFTEVGAKIGALESTAQRTEASMALLGRGGRELGKLFTEGADGVAAMRQQAQDLGLVMDEQTLVAAEKVGDQFSALIALLETRGKAVFLDQVEILARIAEQGFNAADAILAMTQQFRDLEDRGTRNLLHVKTEALELENQLTKILVLMKKQGETRFLGPLPGGILAPGGVTQEDLERLIKEQRDKQANVDAILSQRKTTVERPTTERPVGPPPTKLGASAAVTDDEKKTAKDREALAEKAADAAQASDKAITDQILAEKALVNELVRAQLEAQDRKIDLITEERTRRVEEIERTIQDEQSKNEAILQADATFNAEILAQREKTAAEQKKIEDKVLTVRREALDEFNDAFGNGMAELLGITNDTAKDMFRIFFKEFVLRAVESMKWFQSLNGGGTGDGGFDWLGTAISIGGLFLAKGGITTGPTVANLSEFGQKETVIPFDIRDLDLGGGGVELVINNNAGVNVTPRTQQNSKGRKQIIVELDTMMADAIAQGGKTWQTISRMSGIQRQGERHG